MTRRTYVGEHQFNKRSKAKELKPVEEIVTVAVPPLIDLETFEAVQTRLKANNPKVTPPRVVSGPNLLTGICYCGNCGGAMTLRTGKNDRYRYYACSIRARQGDTGCKGRAIPMDKLDRMVVGHIEERLLDPERIEEVLASLLDRRQEGVERRSKHIAELNQRAAEADMRLKRLYDAIESGSLDPAESALGERITGLTALRDQARADAARTEAMLASASHHSLSGAAVREMASEARGRLRQGKGGYRREHARAFAQRVEVADDAIRIMGTKSTLLRTLVAAKGGKSAGIGVPGFIPKWRWAQSGANRSPEEFPDRGWFAGKQHRAAGNESKGLSGATTGIRASGDQIPCATEQGILLPLEVKRTSLGGGPNAAGYEPSISLAVSRRCVRIASNSIPMRKSFRSAAVRNTLSTLSEWRARATR